MDDEQLAPLACTDKECSFPDPLDESTQRVDDLRQQIQHWRQQLDELHQKHDECIKQIKVLSDSVETLKRELDEKDALLSQEQKELADSSYELKQHIQQLKLKISDLERQLQNAEEQIKAHEKKLMNSAQSSHSTQHSAGVSTSEVQSGCRTCVTITEELNALKLEYDEIIEDLELKNTQLSEENKSLQSKLTRSIDQEIEKSLATITLECEELRQENQQQKHTIDDLERRLKCENDEKSNLHKHNEQLAEEITKLQSELKNVKQILALAEEELKKSRQHQFAMQTNNVNDLNHHKLGAGNKMPKVLEDAENVKYKGEAKDEKFKNPEWGMRPRLRSLPAQNKLRTSVSVKSNLLESIPSKGT